MADNFKNVVDKEMFGRFDQLQNSSNDKSTTREDNNQDLNQVLQRII